MSSRVLALFFKKFIDFSSIFSFELLLSNKCFEYLLNEDDILSIELMGMDYEDESIEFSIIDHPSNGSISGSPPNITYVPNLNFDGVDFFTFTVEDESLLLSDLATITIYINPINDSPIVESVTFNMVSSEDSFDLSLYVSDVDNED